MDELNRERLYSFLTDLRNRLIVITVTVFLAAMVCFALSEKLRQLLLAPAKMAFAGFEGGLDLQLIFLTPSEALLANLKLAFIAGAAVTLPIILYQVVALALSVTGRKKKPFVLTMVMFLLFLLGSSFAYYVVLPFALNFFVSFSSDDLVPSFSIARYISFTSSFIFSFGLVFQLPVFFWFLGSLGLVETSFLRKNRKFALLIIIIFSAVLTPPDIFSQILMAIPLMLLYEIGIFMVYLARRKKQKTEPLTEVEGAAEEGLTGD